MKGFFLLVEAALSSLGDFGLHFIGQDSPGPTFHWPGLPGRLGNVPVQLGTFFPNKMEVVLGRKKPGAGYWPPCGTS